MTRTLEDMIEISVQRAARGCLSHEKAVWILDLKDLPREKTSFSSGWGSLQTFLRYPERLGLCIFLNTPRVFRGTLFLIQTVLSPTTFAKARFVEVDEHGGLTSEIVNILGDSLSSWVSQEIVNARALSEDRCIDYWNPLEPDGRRKLHDPRGQKIFVDSPEFKLTLTYRLGQSWRHGFISTQSRATNLNSADGADHSNLNGDKGTGMETSSRMPFLSFITIVLTIIGLMGWIQMRTRIMLTVSGMILSYLKSKSHAVGRGTWLTQVASIPRFPPAPTTDSESKRGCCCVVPCLGRR